MIGRSSDDPMTPSQKMRDDPPPPDSHSPDHWCRKIQLLPVSDCFIYKHLPVFLIALNLHLSI